MARAPQDPLANIKMVVNDNTISFNEGDTNFNLRLQPVYSVLPQTFVLKNGCGFDIGAGLLPCRRASPQPDGKLKLAFTYAFN